MGSMDERNSYGHHHQSGMPHKFVNAGDSPLRQVAIHASGRMITEWLEE